DFGPNIDRPQLAGDALRPREVRRQRRDALDVEAVGSASVRQQLFGFGNVERRLWSLDGARPIRGNPVALEQSHTTLLGVVHRLAIERHADRLTHADVLEWT